MIQKVLPPLPKYLIVEKANGSLSFLYLPKYGTIWEVCKKARVVPVMLGDVARMAATVCEAYLIINELGGCAVDMG